METHEVPFLRHGAGESPQDGGCIMQVIDWISTGGWTDSPRCVLPYLREAAVCANDWATEEHRQQLLDLVPRLMNTNLGLYERRRVEEGLRSKWRSITLITSAVGVSNWADALAELLDCYDELTGRPKTPVEEIDFSGVCAVMNT